MKFHEVANLFPLLEGKPFNELVEDVKKNGLLEPIWTHDNQVVDGRNRFRACKVAGVEPRFRPWNGKGSLVSFVVSLNLRRRHLTPSQTACVAVEALPFYEAEAKERQKEHGGTAPGRTLSPLMDTVKGRADFFVADDFKVARGYVAAAKAIKLSSPKTFEEVKSGKIKISQVTRQIKKEKQLENLKDLKPLEGKFNVIVVDPPWNIGDYNSDGFRGGATYPTMTIDEIRNIELPAEEDCILWLWAVDTCLEEALEIIKDWGFERKGTLIWNKEKMGLGKWLRRQHEYCFLAVKGKPTFFGENSRSVICSPRGKHSEKPDVFYKLVEETCKYKSKLDYFARKKREGWTVFGDEVK
ncbi:MAG TPA: MT-A70 family methyltransferase [Clostridia bacterium]|nr:MT-A70 family methyltransferase [Clostridia bacterium]